MEKILKSLFAGLFVVSFLFTYSFAADQWDKLLPDDEDSNAADIGTIIQVNNGALDRILAGYREGCAIVYASASTLTVGSGELVLSNAGADVRRFRRNTSNTTVTWANLDSGGENISTTYYVWAIADTDVETFTIKISTSSSAPGSSTYYRRLGYFYNDASGNISYNGIVNDNNYYALQLGNWVTKSQDVTYQATTDGTVCAVSTVSNYLVEGFTDSNSTPTTLMGINSDSGGSGNKSSITFPVRRGDYWYTTGQGHTVYWIPEE